MNRFSYSDNYKVVVMDSTATHVISSALTMYDIMERRVTLVEQLAINRLSFPDMDVIYLVTSTIESVKKISSGFKT
jgi:syntaxin-binding protein 1